MERNRRHRTRNMETQNWELMGTGSREQRTGNRGLGTGNKEQQRTWNCGNREQRTENWEQWAGNREQETRNNRELGNEIELQKMSCMCTNIFLFQTLTDRVSPGPPEPPSKVHFSTDQRPDDVSLYGTPKEELAPLNVTTARYNGPVSLGITKHTAK